MVRFFQALILCALPTVAGAQVTPFYPLDQGGLSLSDADFTMLIDAANSLLQRPHLAVGDLADWRNQQTGSNGTVSVTSAFQHAAMPCVTLTYATAPAGTPPANSVTLDWCKTGDGSWKILS